MIRRWDKSRPPTGPFALNRDCPQAQGLVAWYPMGGPSGKNYVADLAGNRHLSGTVNAITLGNAGQPAISLASASSHYVSNSSLVATTFPLTISAWARPYQANATAALASLSGNLGAGSWGRKLLFLTSSAALNLFSQEDSGTTVNLSATGTYSANQWVHGVGVFAATNSYAVYRDGANKNTSTSTVGFGTPLDTRLGSDNGGNFCNADLGEAGFWNVALNDDLVRRLYDPGTRFELWYPLRSRKWMAPAAGGGSTGTVAYTNANDTSAASGTTTIVGTLARTNVNDTSAANGTTTVVGTLATTNANDTCAASGTVGSSGSTGTVAYTNANDTSAAAGTTTVTGTVATTNANDSVSAAGWAGLITGTLAYTNANDTVSASGSGGTAVATAQQGGGRSRKKYKRPVVVEIDGEDFIVHSEEEAIELLDDAKATAEKRAAIALERATTAKKRKTGQVIRDARKTLTPPVIKAPGLEEYAAQVLADIRDTYQQTMRSVEISALLRKREREEEDDEDVLMLIA